MDADDGAEPAPAGHDLRRRRLVALLAEAVPDDVPGAASPAGLLRLRGRLRRICAIAAREVGVDGAGITVMGSFEAGRAGHRDQLAATGTLTRRLEDLQLTAGEGPCLDAYASGAPVLAPDVRIQTARWLGFAPEAFAAGAAAVFSLPLQLGAVRLGTLDLYRESVGGLSRAELADAVTLADLATETLLEVAADPDDDRAVPVEADLGWLPAVHAEVHVASGMVSARTGIDVGAALLRIRAFAFASGEPIHDVARRIIDRTLFLDDHPSGPDTDGTDRTDRRDDGPPAPEDHE